MSTSVVTLQTFNYRHEAELAQSALEAGGIPSVVVSDDAGRQGLGLQFVRGADLRVAEADLERAREILQSSEVDSDALVPDADPSAESE